MKNKKNYIASLVVIGCLVVGVGIENKVFEKNDVKRVPIHTVGASYDLNIDNPLEVVGDSDYVFVGKVSKNTGTRYENPVPIEISTGEVKYIGEAYTQYEVEVISNIKNDLVINKPIKIEKLGGIREDGSAYDVLEEDVLPEVGKTYVFVAYAQPDGSLLVSGANSNIEFDESSKELLNDKLLENTEEYKQYEDAVKNEIVPIDKVEMESRYDDSK